MDSRTAKQYEHCKMTDIQRQVSIGHLIRYLREPINETDELKYRVFENFTSIDGGAAIYLRYMNLMRSPGDWASTLLVMMIDASDESVAHVKMIVHDDLAKQHAIFDPTQSADSFDQIVELIKHVTIRTDDERGVSPSLVALRFAPIAGDPFEIRVDINQSMTTRPDGNAPFVSRPDGNAPPVSRQYNWCCFM